MTTTKQLDGVAESLQHLEEHLELPYISGDLRDWSEKLRQLLGAAQNRFQTEVGTEHGRAYAAIVKNHSHLRQEVDKLRSDEPQILADLASLTESAEHFASSIDETVLASQQIQPKREQLINGGLKLVLRIRRHRAAIDTWLGEALQRDNGVGD